MFFGDDNWENLIHSKCLCCLVTSFKPSMRVQCCCLKYEGAAAFGPVDNEVMER
jgi:hypothetical protein